MSHASLLLTSVIGACAWHSALMFPIVCQRSSRVAHTSLALTPT